MKGKKQEVDEVDRIQAMQEFEREYWQKGLRVAGIDEAGRGPLAGPVVAAAVTFAEGSSIPLINDSKQLSCDIRNELFDEITGNASAFSIGIASVSEIDEINIYQASVLAMQRAVNELDRTPDHLLIDGRAVKTLGFQHTPIVKGDSRSYSIAAASILAKVTRDRIMMDYEMEFPEYGFSRHKGYATREHLDAIEKHGFCAIHRRSFHPKRFLPTTLPLFDNDEQFA